MIGGPIFLQYLVNTHRPNGSVPASRIWPFMPPFVKESTPPGLYIVWASTGVEVALIEYDPSANSFLGSSCNLLMTRDCDVRLMPFTF